MQNHYICKIIASLRSTIFDNIVLDHFYFVLRTFFYQHCKKFLGAYFYSRTIVLSSQSKTRDLVVWAMGWESSRWSGRDNGKCSLRHDHRGHALRSCPTSLSGFNHIPPGLLQIASDPHCMDADWIGFMMQGQLDKQQAGEHGPRTPVLRF